MQQQPSTTVPSNQSHGCIIDIRGRGIGNAEDYSVTIRVSLLCIFPHNKNFSMTASCIGSEARAINARAKDEAECEASHKIRVTITAILHDMDFSPGTPRMRGMRDAARKVVDAIAVNDCLRARFQCMH